MIALKNILVSLEYIKTREWLYRLRHFLRSVGIMDSTPTAHMEAQRVSSVLSTVNNIHDGNEASESDLISSAQLQELIASLGYPDSQHHQENLEPVVEEMLIQMAEEFIHNVASCSSTLAKHRGSGTLDVKDVQLHLEKHWDIRVPGFDEIHTPMTGSSVIPTAAPAHQKRLSLVRGAVASNSAPRVSSRKRRTPAE